MDDFVHRYWCTKLSMRYGQKNQGWTEGVQVGDPRSQKFCNALSHSHLTSPCLRGSTWRPGNGPRWHMYSGVYVLKTSLKRLRVPKHAENFDLLSYLLILRLWRADMRNACYDLQCFDSQQMALHHGSRGRHSRSPHHLPITRQSPANQFFIAPDRWLALRITLGGENTAALRTCKSSCVHHRWVTKM